MDDAIDTPEYMRTFAQRLAEWSELRDTPRPHPEVPKIIPDTIVMMPMRDGVSLHTEIFFAEGNQAPSATILIRTPYPDSTVAFSAQPIELFRRAGYAVAIQSCRGTWKSEGAFRVFQNEPEDGYDCIAWLADQSWSNGKIGMYGGSYLASVQWLAARLNPPHLTCIAPLSPGGMFFYEAPYVGGVLYKNHLLTWPRFVSRHSWDTMGCEWFATDLDKASPLFKAMVQSSNLDAVRDWNGDDPGMAEAMSETLNHSTLDEWWENIILTPMTASKIDIPVLAVTGFHDYDQVGCLHNWQLTEENEGSAADKRHLIVGPWRHAQVSSGRSAPMGEVSFGSNADMSVPKAALRFFNAYMNDDETARGQLPRRCRLYTSGTNAWHEVSAYPPKESKDVRLFLSSGGFANSLHGDGLLNFAAPVDDEPADRMPADADHPVPAVLVGEDASTNETRYDVLVYTSTPLAEEMTVLGAVRADLFVSVDAPDCDVVIRIEDVRPDGAAVNMTGELGFGAFRARYREGLDQEVLMIPGQPARLNFHVCHMGHSFAKGHRIRIAITATVANLLEPNHHSGEPVATGLVRRNAVEKIHHNRDLPSSIILPVFKAPHAP